MPSFKQDDHEDASNADGDVRRRKNVENDNPEKKEKSGEEEKKKPPELKERKKPESKPPALGKANGIIGISITIVSYIRVRLIVLFLMS